MTSKEALEILFACYCYNGNYQEVIDAREKLEKDLEVLDILKRNSTWLDDEDYNNNNLFHGIDYEELDEKERKIIKEWLENE